MTENLIVDAGYHKGEDTGFYLHKGCKVVAIDASADLVAIGNAQHASDVEKGQLSLHNYAISEKSGEQIEFHLGTNSRWNSINKNVTNRRGGLVNSRHVETITLLDLFKKFGVPYYCKIDLEGMDATAIGSLEKGFLPRYISCELECYGWNETTSPEETLATLHALKELGYDRFKLIDQMDLVELRDKRIWYKKRNPVMLKCRRWLTHLGWRWCGLAQTERQKLSQKHQYEFPSGSSGPGPLDDDYRTPDGWLNYDDIRDLILYYREQRLAYDGKNLWMDIHATFTAYKD